MLAFEQSNEKLRLIDICKITGIHRSTISRIIKVLTSYEFLERNPQNKKISLGQTSLRLARSLKRSLKTNLVHIAKPYVDELRGKLRETVFLENLVRKNWIMAYAAESYGPFRLVTEVGEKMHINAASGGKTFLAYASPKIRDSLLEEELHALPVRKIP